MTDVLPVLRELRNHLTPKSLRSVYDEGAPQGLRFLAAYRDRRCVGVAGWRIVANTSAGRKLYIDDLVTTSSVRSSGVGAAMLAERSAAPWASHCSSVDLDSGIARTEAHRFYERQGFTNTAIHFVRHLPRPAEAPSGAPR